jgi:anti-sigma regulatory factor (Ser/Thr protein kinase)
VGNGSGSPRPAPEPDPGDAVAAIARYDEARRRGSRLVLSGATDVHDTIRGWLRATPVLDDLPARERDLLTSTLYEVCANVAEHGYARDPAREYEVWWVPAAESAEGARSPRARTAAGTAVERLRQGWFLVRDEGAPFSANEWKSQNFDDPRVRRRGRGLGLEIIHRTMRRIVYCPSTAVGNVTWMCFGGSPSPEEASHAG